MVGICVSTFGDSNGSTRISLSRASCCSGESAATSDARCSWSYAAAVSETKWLCLPRVSCLYICLDEIEAIYINTNKTVYPLKRFNLGYWGEIVPTLRQSTSRKAPSIELLLAIQRNFGFVNQIIDNLCSMFIHLCTVMSTLIPFLAISSSIRKPEKMFVLARVDRMHTLQMLLKYGRDDLITARPAKASADTVNKISRTDVRTTALTICYPARAWSTFLK